MNDSPRDGPHPRFAEPNAPIDYEPFRQSYVLPRWKDTRGLYAKRPSRELGAARNEDKAVYYSREIMDREWERLWTRVWLMVGHLSDIPKPDAFMKVDRGLESVLVVRGEGENIRAMYNVCQHRGTRLVVQDFGTARKFTCPFHKWEFSNTGELLKITDRETFREEAICHDLDLPKVRSAVWRGWIFVSFDDDAPPLEDWLGEGFIDLARAYDFERVLRIRDVQQEWPVNWKTAHEAFIEGYHVQATHPQLLAAVDSYHAQTDLLDHGHGHSVYQFMSPAPPPHHPKRMPDGLCEENRIFLREAGIPEAEWPRHWSEVPQAIIKAKLAKKDYSIDYSKFSEGQLVDDWNLGLFPTTEMFLHPEGFFIQNWLPHPTDPEKCFYLVQVYAVPGIGELPSFMAVENADLSGKRVLGRTYIDVDDFENLGPVIKQDRLINPRVQQGLHSKGFKGAVYSEQEIRIRHFFDEYNKIMGNG